MPYFSETNHIDSTTSGVPEHVVPASRLSFQDAIPIGGRDRTGLQPRVFPLSDNADRNSTRGELPPRHVVGTVPLSPSEPPQAEVHPRSLDLGHIRAAESRPTAPPRSLSLDPETSVRAPILPDKISSLKTLASPNSLYSLPIDQLPLSQVHKRTPPVVLDMPLPQITNTNLYSQSLPDLEVRIPRTPPVADAPRVVPGLETTPRRYPPGYFEPNGIIVPEDNTPAPNGVPMRQAYPYSTNPDTLYGAPLPLGIVPHRLPWGMARGPHGHAYPYGAMEPRPQPYAYPEARPRAVPRYTPNYAPETRQNVDPLYDPDDAPDEPPPRKSVPDLPTGPDGKRHPPNWERSTPPAETPLGPNEGGLTDEQRQLFAKAVSPKYSDSLRPLPPALEAEVSRLGFRPDIQNLTRAEKALVGAAVAYQLGISPQWLVTVGIVENNLTNTPGDYNSSFGVTQLHRGYGSHDGELSYDATYHKARLTPDQANMLAVAFGRSGSHIANMYQRHPHYPWPTILKMAQGPSDWRYESKAATAAVEAQQLIRQSGFYEYFNNSSDAKK